jgi:predicted AlkP superfamily phosphohydrolase/phosphomutase
VVIGLDGCSWNVLEPLLDTGRLPHLAELRERGSSGVLESTIPFYTGPAWASYATGSSPAAHGVYDFMMLREDGNLSVAHQSDLRRPTYYQQLGREGRRSILINLPLDQDGCEGAVIVNSWLTVDDRRRVFPTELASRYQAQLRAYKNYPTTFDADLDTHLRDVCELEQSRFDLARELFVHEEWDHFFVLFSSTDWFGHMATGLFLQGDGAAFAAFLRLYEELDRHVGWLVEHAGDATVVVMSDHGQCAEEHVVRPNRLLRDLGLVRLVRERETAADERVVRLPGTLRRLAALPGARHGAAAARALLRRRGVDLVTPRHGFDVDRAASRAFVPTVASYAVHAPGCDEAEREEIVEGLRALVLEDGRPAFDGVWHAEELYGREIPPGCPAIVFAPAVGVRPSVSATAPLVGRAKDPGRGAHQRDGMVIVAGPHVVPGELGRPSIYDIAPTLLWLMDAAVPSGGDGRPLYEAFEPQLVEENLFREVDEVFVGAGAPTGGQGDDEVTRRLEALGYLG